MCCIYHKPRAVDESSSEDHSSSSSSDSDSDSDFDREGDPACPENLSDRDASARDNGCNKGENEGGDGACGHHKCSGKRKRKTKKGDGRPNAYERQPNTRKRGSRTVTALVDG